MVRLMVRGGREEGRLGNTWQHATERRHVGHELALLVREERR
jgi:hypothetical protein